MRSAELCAGAGGAAVGRERAGFAHVLRAEIDPDACAMLRLTRRAWKVAEGDIRHLDGCQLDGIDLLSGGCPCSPFTSAGRQLGESDSRDMFPEASRLIAAARPRAILLENVPGLLASKFAAYRQLITGQLETLGYAWDWRGRRARARGGPPPRPPAVPGPAPPPGRGPVPPARRAGGPPPTPRGPPPPAAPPRRGGAAPRGQGRPRRA